MVEHRLPEALQVLGSQKPWRATAPENRIDRPPFRQSPEFFIHRPQVAVQVLTLRLFLIKGTKITGRRTKWDVTIQANRLGSCIDVTSCFHLFFLQDHVEKAYLSCRFMKAKRIFPLLSVSALLVLVGCQTKMANMTPTTVPTNPSGIYTLSFQSKLDFDLVEPGTAEAYVVIDGKKQPMTQSDLGPNFFEYDYAIPEGRTQARYYYILKYLLKRAEGDLSQTRTFTSEVEEMRLVDRFSITLDANRAPIGTQLAALGRGFSRSDKVYVGGVPSETQFISSNALQFIVPNVAPGSSYSVEIRGGQKEEFVGTLRVDPGIPLSVIPQTLDIQVGQRQALAFALDYPAPAGGLYLDVTTDIPNSIIMPEVMIPEGSRTVSVTVEGGDPGQGTLYINASGFSELKIPATVR